MSSGLDHFLLPPVSSLLISLPSHPSPWGSEGACGGESTRAGYRSPRFHSQHHLVPKNNPRSTRLSPQMLWQVSPVFLSRPNQPRMGRLYSQLYPKLPRNYFLENFKSPKLGTNILENHISSLSLGRPHCSSIELHTAKPQNLFWWAIFVLTLMSVREREMGFMRKADGPMCGHVSREPQG